MAVTISLSIAQNSQSVANNTSNVTVKLTAKWTYGSHNNVVDASGTPQAKGWVKIDGTTYNFASKFNTGETTSGSAVIFTKTLNVSHSSDGTKTLACSASYATGVSSGTVTASASKTLTTIPRKSSLSVSAGTLGTSQTLTVNKQASSFTHTIWYYCGNVSGTICYQSSSTSITWTPPLSLASQNTTGTSVSIKFTIYTYSGSTSIGSNTTSTLKYAIPASVKPSCSVTVTDPTGYASTYGGYIKGISKFKVTVTPTLAYGSAISVYRTTANGSTYSNSSFTTDVLKSSGTLTVSAKVTDKRGRSSSTVSVSNTVLDYAPPTITRLLAVRCNADGSENNQGDHIKVVVTGNITSLSNKNTASYRLEYKKTSESSYTPIDISDGTVYSLNVDSIIFEADVGSSYDIRFTATDNFDTTTKTAVAPTGFTLMHWMKSGLGMAIGKIAEIENLLDIGLQVRFFGGILHPVLEPETDLNDIRTPNTYVGANTSTYAYANCPLTSGTFTLVVNGAGENGQVHQILTACNKANPLRYERMYYSGTWGEWICTSDFDGVLLASPSMYMTAGHTVTLSEPVSKQRHGIVLIFSEYVDGAVKNQSFHCKFIPKMMVSMHSGSAQCIQLCTSNLAYFATKYLYISDTQITGHDNNNQAITGSCGITSTNNRFVLRYVIGV